MRHRLVVLVAVAGLVGTVVFGVLWWQQRSVADERSAALDAAKRLAVDFTTYDHETLDEDVARVERNLVPGDFKDEYETTTGRLRESLIRYGAVSTSTVEAAGLQSMTGDRATVVLMVDQQVTTNQADEPRLDRNRMVVTVEKSGDTWKLADLVLK